MMKVIYKHWKTEKELTVIGTMPEKLNNTQSDRFVVKTSEGFEDVLKNTVIRIEELR